MGRTGVGTLYLWLCAVVCLAQGQDLVNVAPNKTYSQSSTYSTQRSSTMAANGDTSPFFPANCIHTSQTKPPAPWFEVNLGRTYPVYNITLWARNTLQRRLNSSIITVDGQTCASITSFPNDTREKTVTCPSVMYGQRVRITRQLFQGLGGDSELNLCEIQIWVPREVSECEAGRYGTSCNTNCSGHCGKGSGKNFCYQSSGYCYDDCVSGWYGDQCFTPCSPGCQNTTCDRQPGHCSPCNTGYEGAMCQDCKGTHYKNNNRMCVQCSANCQSQSCEDATGKCQGCAAGHYGDTCGMLCPKCQRCDQETGVCTACPLNSHLQLPNCTECQDGYYKNSDTCVRCSTDCRAQSCDKTNGTCHGCVDGRYEDKCTSVCPTANCRQCHQTTGQCEECAQNSNLQPPNCTECQDGYYKNSDTCVRCSMDCPAQSCDKTNGTCHGCVDGRYEDKCTSVCPTANCRQCHQTTGQCKECAQNSKLQPPNCTDNKNENNTAAIAGAVVAAIVVIIIVVIIGVVVMRRRRCNAKSRGPESGTSNTAQNDGQRREPERHASSPLSFTPLVHSGGKNGAKPKAHVEPLQAAVAKPKPTGADGSVYQNVSPPQRTSATPPRAQTAPQNGTATSGSRPLTDDEELEDLWAGEEPIYSNDPAYTNFIRVDQLQKTIVDSLQDGKVAKEFAFMVGLKQYPLTSGKREENYNKNRFKPIVPYDRNRVILEQLGTDDSSDYINASFVKGYKTDKDYIAAQGPKSNTQDDFWRMVWQEGVTDIVMLTNLKEGNKAKCHEYWPAKGTSVNTGHMEVTGLEEEERAHFIIRTFSVQQLQSKAKRQVSQYHYIKWMDHEVPSTTPLVNFWRYVRARAPRNPRAPPLLVHCSAGVGRTGTYIALDILIDQTQEQEEISLYHTVDNLRKYRCHMVQNKSQYQFLHEAVLEAYMSGDCRLQTSSFDHVFPSPIHHDQPHPRIDAEFRRLCQMRTCLTHPSHTVASLEENRHKNCNPDALPDDSHMVYITEQAKGRNQYINAVYMPTFLSSRGSIVTQLPLADTVIDFWRLVDSWNVRTIVSIGQVEGDKGMSRYWPKAEGQPVKCGAYTISLKSVNFLGDTLRSFVVELKKPNQSRELRVLHYEAWTGQVADNVSDLLRLLDTLHTSHTQSTKEPIIIQCIDGVAQSGAVCALWDVISRMKCDGEVDVYQAVRHVHTVRPEAVTSVVQYRFLYKVAQEFRDSQTTYANT